MRRFAACSCCPVLPPSFPLFFCCSSRCFVSLLRDVFGVDRGQRLPRCPWFPRGSPVVRRAGSPVFVPCSKSARENLCSDGGKVEGFRPRVYAPPVFFCSPSVRCAASVRLCSPASARIVSARDIFTVRRQVARRRGLRVVRPPRFLCSSFVQCVSFRFSPVLLFSSVRPCKAFLWFPAKSNGPKAGTCQERPQKQRRRRRRVHWLPAPGLPFGSSAGPPPFPVRPPPPVALSSSRSSALPVIACPILLCAPLCGVLYFCRKKQGRRLQKPRAVAQKEKRGRSRSFTCVTLRFYLTGI